MSSATTTTGRHGKLWAGAAGASLTANANQVKRTTQWSVSQKPAAVMEWGDSDGGGFTNRAPGRRDATWTAEGKFDLTTQQWDVFQGGDYCAAELYVNSQDYSSLKYAFSRSVCTEFGLVVNIDTEEVVAWTSGWGNDGTFTTPGGAWADVPYA